MTTHLTTSPPANPLNLDPNTALRGVVRLEPPFRTWPCTLNSFTGGAFSYVSPQTALHNVHLGRYCSIGDHVSILSSHPTQGLTTSPVLYQALFPAPFQTPNPIAFNNLSETVIGNDVWIGAGVQIKTGVTIGDGAIIGAGSVVTHDVAPFMVVGGVPARVIRSRFPEQTTARLQKLAWWRYNIVELPLSGDNPETSMDELESALDKNTLKPYLPGYYQVWKDQKTGQILGRKEAGAAKET